MAEHVGHVLVPHANRWHFNIQHVRPFTVPHANTWLIKHPTCSAIYSAARQHVAYQTSNVFGHLQCHTPPRGLSNIQRVRPFTVPHANTRFIRHATCSAIDSATLWHRHSQVQPRCWGLWTQKSTSTLLRIKSCRSFPVVISE